MNIKPVVLCILDGWGETHESPHNAIRLAHTPNWDALQKKFPHTTLNASEEAVGLPKGQMGNSEVGHITIGAGRVIYQDLPRVDQAIAQDELATNPQLIDFIKTLRNEGTDVCHLLGLLSPGGVHSHQDHLVALCKIFAQNHIQVYVHAFLDGRDTPPQSAHTYVQAFLSQTSHFPTISLASLGGRYFGMDRDNRWERIKTAYDAIVLAQASRFENALAYIDHCYQQGITDEFIAPAVSADYPGMKDGDGLLESNFRADRVRQLLTALLMPDFTQFQRDKQPCFACATGMTQYSQILDQHMMTLFPPQQITHCVGEVVAQAGLKQLRLAETEKYAHVTFFFNGGEEEPFAGEDRLLISSPKVATYDLKPEMSAVELTNQLIQALYSNTYALIVVNYANTDMVGHSGKLEATIQAVECIDRCLGRLYETIQAKDAILLITADHGNAETMCNPLTQEPHTAHTTNPVPFLLIGRGLENVQLRSMGELADIAPTLLTLLQVPTPLEMTGKNLLRID